jgi:CAAX protease family protein
VNRRKTAVALCLTIILLLVANISLVHFSGWLHIVLSAFGILCLYAVYRYANLSIEDVGLEKDKLQTGIKYGLACSVIIFAVLLLIFFIDPTVFKDPRYHQPIITSVFSAIFIEPFKTVLFEELAFRGILLAILLKLTNQKWTAVIVSSVLFGLWHVTSSAAIGNYHAASSLVINRAYIMIAAVCITSLAGVILSELKLRSKSLAAPLVVHWVVDALSIVLAAISWH